MQLPAPEDPLVGLLHAFPCGMLLLRDSLAASGHFLLPWLTAAALGQGHKYNNTRASNSTILRHTADEEAVAGLLAHLQVVFIAAAYSPAKHTAALKKIGAPGLAAAAAARLPGQAASSSASIALVCDEQQAAALLHQLTALGEVLQVPYRLVLLAAADVPADRQLVAAAAARAHVIADVSPLEGRTAALDGSLRLLVRRGCSSSSSSSLQQQQQQQQGRGGWLCPGSSSTWFFRAGDVGVRWLPEVHGKELVV
ncbi:hypothetical protein OEZ86_004229 [Tetradesmus obliquus]|nr:hypothetical protein OEZ86_004229 [Tetradesmus obliquus]